MHFQRSGADIIKFWLFYSVTLLNWGNLQREVGGKFTWNSWRFSLPLALIENPASHMPFTLPFLFSVFTHQHPYFKFTFRSFKCDIHAFHCYVDVRCVCCGAECDMLAAQCNILVGHWTSRLSELTFRWYAAVQNMWAQEWSGFACQDGGVQKSVRHHPADDWKSRQSSYYLVRNWWNIAKARLSNSYTSEPW